MSAGEGKGNRGSTKAFSDDSVIYHSFTSASFPFPVTHPILAWVIFMNERILIAEDDPAISRLIDTNLTLSSFKSQDTGVDRGRKSLLSPSFLRLLRLLFVSFGKKWLQRFLAETTLSMF